MTTNEDGGRAQIIDTRRGFREAVVAAIEEAGAAGCRTLVCCDPDFVDWPLGERDCVEALSRWVHARARLVLLAGNFERIGECHARWLAWRQRWSHAVECRAVEDVEAGQLPTLLLAPGMATLRLDDRLHWRGRVLHDAFEAVRCQEVVDALMQRSVESFPATHLGL